MKIKLELLKPNPFRDLQIDPVDLDAVKMLRASIREHGFWSGTVVRKAHNGSYETAAGWTRVLAAKGEGIDEAEIFVGKFDDQQMVRAYVAENATQRGNTATALTGAIATAIMQIAKMLISDPEHLPQICETSSKAIEVARGNLMNGRGVGQDLIEAYLHDVPGINESTIKDQLASLKASGHYRRLITQIAEEAAEVHADEAEKVEELTKQVKEAPTKQVRQSVERQLTQKPLHVARRTVENVKDDEKTFDLEGVSKHLKNPYQVRVFRQTVTTGDMQEVLPVKNQAALASKLAKQAKEDDEELSGDYIKREIGMMIGEERFKATQANKKQLEILRLKQAQIDFTYQLNEFKRGAGVLSEAESKLSGIVKAHGFELPHYYDSISRVENVTQRMRKLFPQTK